MKLRAVFICGDAIIGVIEFEGHWEDFVQKYEFDQVLQKKVELENLFGSTVSVRVEPKAALAASRRTFLRP